MKLVYNLEADKNLIKIIQEASADKKSTSGLKIENNLLFGSKEWFQAIGQGLIKTHTIHGTITKVFMSGHNDYPEFELESEEGKSRWTRNGLDEFYKIGKRVELTYAEQKFKRPIAILGPISKCVLSIKIEQ